MSKVLDKSMPWKKTIVTGFYASVVVLAGGGSVVSLITMHSQTELPISLSVGQPGRRCELTSSILGPWVRCLNHKQIFF